MVGAVSMQSLYIEPDAIPGLPTIARWSASRRSCAACITEALNLPLEYELEGRAGALMQLIQHEMQQLPVLPLSLQYPAHGPLSARCRRFVRAAATFMRRSTIGPRRSAMSRRVVHAPVPARDGPEFRGVAPTGLPALRDAPARGGRTGDDGCNRPRLREPGRVHADVPRAFGVSPLTYLGVRNTEAPSRSADA